jgi:site-specific DNA-methyltransferase (adenine-specific)
MTPFYDRGGIQIYHADCRDILPALGAGTVDLLCTDPPFDEQTHDRARSVTVVDGVFKGGKKHVTFEPIRFDDLKLIFAMAARACARWLVSTLELRHSVDLERADVWGWKFVRHGAWVKTKYTPQISGDRPAQGWEAIAIMHRDVGGKMEWNDGGHCAVYHHPTVTRGVYPTEKPIALIREIVADFIKPGGLILDPFCGSGTTLVAAAERGHPAIGCDKSKLACEIAAARVDAVIAQGKLFAGKGGA